MAPPRPPPPAPTPCTWTNLTPSGSATLELTRWSASTPATEEFLSFPLPSNPGNVRQILGRPGEIWGAESAADSLVVIRFRPAEN